jgi:hypothetical protein
MIVSWMLRIGFLLGPPVVGVVADAVSLRVGLMSMVLAGVVVVLLGGALRDRTPGREDATAAPVG